MYQLEKEYELTGKAIYLGDEKNKICRFCGKTEPEVKFEKRAHVVSEFLGNKSLFSHYECDECNDRFSKYEGNLADALIFYRGVVGARGKKKRIKLSGAIESRLHVKSRTLETKFSKVDFKKDHVGFAYNDNQAFYIINKRINYFLCYKAFVKFAVSILPENELLKCKKFIKFLEEGNFSNADKTNYLYYIKIFEGNLISPKARFYKKTDVDSDYPSYLFSFDYDLFQFYVFLVLEGEKRPENINIALHNNNSIEKYLRVRNCREDKMKQYTFTTLVNGKVSVTSPIDAK